MDAHYRKHNDRSLCSSTYHKKDGTNVRAILKEELKSVIDETLEIEQKIKNELSVDNVTLG